MLAILAVVLASIIKALFLDRLAADTTFLPYFPAVALAAAWGGFRAGVAATLAAAVIDIVAFVAPPGQLLPTDQADLVRLLLFVVVGITISALTGQLRGVIRVGAQTSARDAGHLVQEREARTRAEALARQGAAVATIGEHALTGLPVQRLMEEASSLVAETLATPIVSITKLDEPGRVLLKVAGVGWPEGVIGKARVPLGRDSHAGFTLAADGPVVVEDFATESRFSPSPFLAGVGPKSGMGVRIGDARQPYGVLAVYLREPRRFSDDEANFLQAVANVLAAAIARAEAVDALERSRDQLEAVLSSVGDAITVQRNDGTLAYANEEAARMVGFASGAELVAAPVADVLTHFDVLDEDGDPLPSDELPGRRALAGDHVPERLVRFRIRETGEERWSVVGATPVVDDAGEVRFAINIFRDVTHRKRHEDAERFLADATAALATSLDERTTVRMLADLAVRRMADWCVVDIVSPEGSVDFAIAHLDPSRRDLGHRLRERFPFDVKGTSGPGRVMATGEPELFPDLHRLIETVPPEMAEVIRTLDLRSYLCAPLISRGRPIGVVTMLTEGAGRRFDSSDLTMAVELGQRAGVAIKQARLYREADARRAELTAVLAAMGEAVMVFDGDDQLAHHNPAAVDVFSDDPPRTLAELRDVLPLQGTTPPWERPGQGESIQVRGADGRWLDISTYRTIGEPGPDDPASGRGLQRSTILVIRDITASRQAQQAREAFIGLLSHELRTPITTIYGGTRLLDRPLAEEQRQELLRDIRVESERLFRLVEDLLVMTRVERGGVEIGDEPLLLQRILSSVVMTEESRWPGLTVRVSLPSHLPAVRGELTYVEQVVRNLLTNAAKYGGVERPIDLVAEESGGEVIVRVQDRGPGISDEDAERLFDLFYRGAATAAKAGGAGIGLFVCRALVTAMGGRIWATSREGGGAEFCFSMPVLEVDEAA
jgi:PAS domain S-box-containing protein